LKEPSNKTEPFIWTWSGGRFDFLNPSPGSICITDIAHALSLICRFNGHCTEFYSVAEHCVEVADRVMKNSDDPKLARTALLHDAAEAYIGDVVSPLKALLPDFQRVETAVEEIIAQKYDLYYPFPPEIKQADRDVLADEFARLQPFAESTDSLWTPLPPEEAEQVFMTVFLECFGRERPLPRNQPALVADDDQG